MRLFATIILAALLCATASAQTLKSLMYNTTNGRVAYSGTNVLTFAANSNSYTPASFQMFGNPSFSMSIVVSDEGLSSGYDAPSGSIGSGANVFQIKHGTNNDAWASPLLLDQQPGVYFGATWLTNTNVTNFRTAVGLGNTNNVVFGEGTEINVGVGVGLTNTGLATGGGTMQGRLGLVEGGNVVAVLDADGAPFFGLYQPITFQGTNATANVAATRTNLGLGATNAVTFNRLIAGATNQPLNASGNIVAQNGSGEEFHINVGGFTFYQGTNAGGFMLAEERALGGGTWTWESPFTFATASDAATTRTNLGLPLAALTNTSNVTAMRALGGSTNTNEPYSGTVALTNTNVLTFSNGVLLRIQ